MEVIDIKDPTNKKEFIELLDVAVKYAHGLLALLETMGKNLEVNAINEAKAELIKLQEVKPSQSYIDFMASLDRGDHLTFITEQLKEQPL